MQFSQAFPFVVCVAMSVYLCMCVFCPFSLLSIFFAAFILHFPFSSLTNAARATLNAFATSHTFFGKLTSCGRGACQPELSIWSLFNALRCQDSGIIKHLLPLQQ